MKKVSTVAVKKDSHILGKVGALLIGVGVGVGVGLLIAPARGEETRADITEKVSSSVTKSGRILGRSHIAQPGLTATRGLGCDYRRAHVEKCCPGSPASMA